MSFKYHDTSIFLVMPVATRYKYNRYKYICENLKSYLLVFCFKTLYHQGYSFLNKVKLQGQGKKILYGVKSIVSKTHII